MFRSYRDASEDQEAAFRLVSLSLAATLLKAPRIGSNSQLFGVLQGGSKPVDPLRRQLQIQHRTKKSRPEQRRIAVLGLARKTIDCAAFISVSFLETLLAMTFGLSGVAMTASGRDAAVSTSRLT